MALKIRMARGGAKKRPFYRIVVADVRSPRDGRFIERLGTYNPLLPKDSDERVKLNEERIKHWLSLGAKPSDRVNRFLDDAGILKREARNNPNKAKPGKKRVEREEAAAIAAKQAEEDAKQAAEAPAEEPAEEAPAEEVAVEASAEEAKTEETPTKDAPAEEAAEAPAEETKIEEAPAEEAKKEEAAEEAPAEEPAGDGDDDKAEKAE